MYAIFILCCVAFYVAAYPEYYYEKRIVGGSPAQSSTWPMIVSLRQRNLQGTLKWMQVPYTSDNGHFCGGTLLNSDWVVTAASCFPDRDVQKLLNEGQFTFQKVRKLIWLMRTLVRRMNLEDYRICLNDDCSRWSGISNIIIHPGYLISIGKNSPGFDIAMIKLTTSVGPFIPGLIPKNDLIKRNRSLTCKSGGWGVEDVTNKLNSGEFREFDVELVDSKICNPFIKRLELCGLGEKIENRRSDFCFFDGGGPLMCRNEFTKGHWNLVGLISRGTKDTCGDPGQGGIYTDLLAYRHWMATVMKQQSKL